VEELLDLKTVACNRERLVKACSIENIDDVREVLNLFVDKIAGPVVETQPDNRL
jgi:hypothetical protein